MDAFSPFVRASLADQAWSERPAAHNGHLSADLSVGFAQQLLLKKGGQLAVEPQLEFVLSQFRIGGKFGGRLQPFQDRVQAFVVLRIDFELLKLFEVVRDCLLR